MAPISRRTFIKTLTLTGVALSSASVLYASAVESKEIEITTHNVPLRNLTPKFNGYKIIQITDLHMGSWLNRERLADVVSIINSHQPDLIAITGDFISLGRIQPHVAELVGGLQKLHAPDGVVAVLGNHDHYANVEITREMLVQANIIELPNEHLIIDRGDEQLVIAGLDDVYEDQHDLRKLISGLQKDLPTLLLAHEPDVADETSRTGYFGLQISGHSHGGQIRLPALGALI